MPKPVCGVVVGAMYAGNDVLYMERQFKRVIGK
jgi:hypothetical protein